MMFQGRQEKGEWKSRINCLRSRVRGHEKPKVIYIVSDSLVSDYNFSTREFLVTIILLLDESLMSGTHKRIPIQRFLRILRGTT